MRLTNILLALTAAMLLATSALAANFKVTYGTGVKTLKATYNGQTKTYGTTEFDVDVDDPVDGLYDHFDITAYCLQIDETTSNGEHFTNVQYVSVLDDKYGQDYMNAAYLMKNYAPGLGHDDFMGYGLAYWVAGLQAAIWQLIYGDDFSLHPGTNDKIEAVFAYLLDPFTQGFNATAQDVDGYLIAEMDNGQDLLMPGKGFTSAPVPVPGAAWLIASAFAGLLGMRRMNRS